MRRISVGTFKTQFAITPAIGIIKKTTGFYRYKYRISVIWLVWGISIGLCRICRKRKTESKCGAKMEYKEEK